MAEEGIDAKSGDKLILHYWRKETFISTLISTHLSRVSCNARLVFRNTLGDVQLKSQLSINMA